MIVFPWKTNLCAEAHKSNPKSIFHSHMQPQCCMCCSYEQPDRSLQCLPCGPALTNVLIGQLGWLRKYVSEAMSRSEIRMNIRNIDMMTFSYPSYLAHSKQDSRERFHQNKQRQKGMLYRPPTPQENPYVCQFLPNTSFANARATSSSLLTFHDYLCYALLCRVFFLESIEMDFVVTYLLYRGDLRCKLLDVARKQSCRTVLSCLHMLSCWKIDKTQTLSIAPRHVPASSDKQSVAHHARLPIWRRL
jgi:hypothetical protein